MPNFGSRSRERLYTTHPKFQMLFEEIVRKHDCSIIYGVRTLKEQKILFDKGASKTMKSKHIKQPDGWSHAVDVMPYPVDWNNTKRFYWFAGIVIATADAMGIKVRWGGDWDSDDDFDDQKFMDLVHFELVEN